MEKPEEHKKEERPDYLRADYPSNDAGLSLRQRIEKLIRLNKEVGHGGL
jgi:hypothetical protein